MDKLSEEDLWSRITAQAGGVIYTIDRRVPNRIERVTASKVIRRSAGSSKPSSVARKHFWNIYNYLWEHCVVTHRELNRDDFPGKPVKSQVSRFVLAVLTKAAPEHIAKFKRDADKRHSGIRLRMCVGKQ